MEEDKLVSAYKYVFNKFHVISDNEDVAKDAIQTAILEILAGNVDVSSAKDLKSILIYVSKNYKRTMFMKNSWLSYDSTTGVIRNGDDEISRLDARIMNNDYGQISSILHKIELDNVIESLGDNFDFVMNHIEFHGSGRGVGRLGRGATGISHRPRIYESDKDRYKMNYVIKKLRKEYKHDR